MHVKVYVLGSYTEKSKIVDRGSLSSAPESVCSRLQYEPFLFSVGVLRPSYSFRENFGRSGKMLFTDKAKIVDRGYQSCALESTGCKLQYEPYLSSVACS